MCNHLFLQKCLKENQIYFIIVIIQFIIIIQITKKMNTFTDQYRRIYSAKKWTFQHFFCIFVYFVIFALPFYFSFTSKNFWFDTQFALMEVDYLYTGKYAVKCNNSLYTNLPMDNISASPTIQMNNSATEMKFNFNYPSLQTPITIILFFDVQVPTLDKIASSSFSVSLVRLNNFDVTVTSKLSLQVSTPFNALTSLSSYTVNRPTYYNQSFNYPTTFQELINIQLSNPYKLQSQTYIQYQNTQSNTITLNLMKNRFVVLPYYPSILQTFKFKFSTYFGMLILSYLIFYNLMLQLAKDQALQCNQKDEIPINLIKNN